MEISPPHARRIMAVILAAGLSSRFGSTKQLASLGDETLLGRAIRIASAVCGSDTLLVLGHNANAVAAATSGHLGKIIVNTQYQQGIGTSISLAACTLDNRADALLLLLADQPLVSDAHLRAIVGAWSGTDDEIVASAYAGTQGPPVLLPRATFGDLKALDGDRGARPLLDDPRFTTRAIHFEAAACDIDTPDDLARIIDK